MNSILLIGFMGAGKSTVGSLLAQKLNWPMIDLDDLITEKIQMPINDYFDQFGEATFRQVESNVLKDNLRTKAIIATGGGIVVSALNRSLLKAQPKVIYLKTEPQTLVTRIKNDTKNIRPLATEKSEGEIISLLNGRLTHYEDSAAIVVETTERSPEEIVEEIMERLAMA